MRQIMITLVLILFSFSLFAETLALHSPDTQSPEHPSHRTAIAPVVTNVTASQRIDGSKIVDVYYDLFDANADLCYITFRLSADGGASFDIIPSAANLSGDFGEDQPGGTDRHIIWDAGAESYSLNASYLYRVYADDGTSPIPQSFILVQGGTFNNGSSNVTVSSFYLDRYELTQADYQAVMDTNPSYFSSIINGPVECVSWFDAIEYCNRRSMQEGLTPCYSYGSYGTNPANWPAGWNISNANHTNVSCSWTADGYRLPTEAEWEFAARGGNQTQNYTYSGSDDINAVAWHILNSGSTSHTVGTKAANELGIYDMTGNVREWTWDIRGNYPGGAQTNPHGAASGSYRIFRGGGWASNARSSTVSYRDYNDAGYSNAHLGFRICRAGLHLDRK